MSQNGVYKQNVPCPKKTLMSYVPSPNGDFLLLFFDQNCKLLLFIHVDYNQHHEKTSKVNIIFVKAGPKVIVWMHKNLIDN